MAFNKLKETLSTTPILMYTDYSKPFGLITDVSELGLGAALYQEQDHGTEQPITFASRALSDLEWKYHPGKLKFLTLKWAITEKFQEYLYGGCPFEVWTDNNPLTYLLTTAKLDATGHCWVGHLANYNLSLKYIKGNTNVVTDALSRVEVQLDPAMVSATLVGAVIRLDEYAKVDSIDNTDTLSRDVEEKAILAKAVNSMDCKWTKIQHADVVIAAVIHWLESGKKGSIMTALPEDTPEADCKSLKREANRFHLVNRLLYHNAGADTQSISVKQFLVPTLHWIEAIKGCHHDASHQGLERTMALMKEQYFWPSMNEDIHSQIAKYQRCTAWRKPAEKAPLQLIHATMPLKLFHLDYFQIENPNEKGKIEAKYVLMVTDHFTRYMMGFITPD